MFRQLSDHVYASPQIGLAEVAEAADVAGEDSTAE